ncbi:substrate-binding periplasmic protein [Gulosibacter chungangensis]|uniref:Amino acid ABC transporter substrate-binding protein n=1 Tax=Gulosibacter chungangensis TaxID=979746 RepID=A0A7J5BF03_9MICO|nr:ABC transporter substrate-binding protein [Gulosibacter chungangensis]KAB1644836.1 amino acid ABC transporter substrate-binding protein [Gulosibacter chungangensis]
MTKRIKLGATLAALGLGAAFALTGCASGGGGSEVAEDCVPAHADLPTMTAGVLTVGISDMPPLVTPSGDAGFEGLDADIITGFAEAECLSIEPVNVGATAAVTSVEQGRVDTSLGGWYRTEARNEVVTMSGPMYLDGLIVAANDPFSTFTELEGMKVGVVQGYNFEEDLRDVFGSNLSTYPEPTLLAEDLSSGRIDAAFDVSSAALMYGDAVISVLEPDPRVAVSELPAQTGLPFQKGKDALVEAFNEHLTSLHESGEMATLLEKWDLDPSLAEVGEPRFS